MNKCPQDCAFNPWTDWSECSQSCGTGTHTRTRSIGRYQEFGGKPCAGPRVEKASCSVNDCPVDGQWTEWSPWGYCDQSCGEGIRIRTRDCSNPRPENGGQKCPQEDEMVQKEVCQIKKCAPVNGNWSPWSRWSKCDAECGEGRIKRTRRCDSPVPANGGGECQGETSQTRKCFLRRCENQRVSPEGNEKPLLVTQRIKKKPPLILQPKTAPQKAISNSSLYCDKLAPKIRGFFGPLRFKSDVIESEEPLRIKKGGKVFYKCAQGRVTDVTTNAAFYTLRCSDEGELKSSDPSPVCVMPENCVGAPKRFNDEATNFVPRRDSEVNSALFVACQDHEELKLAGSCFPDGKYRLSTERHPCDNEMQRSQKVSV